jgi:hypothetical protein
MVYPIKSYYHNCHRSRLSLHHQYRHLHCPHRYIHKCIFDDAFDDSDWRRYEISRFPIRHHHYRMEVGKTLIKKCLVVPQQHYEETTIMDK